MADLEHANSLLRMAHKDFNALVGMQGNSLFADEIFGFHVQQAVEKSLKARLFSLLENQGAEVEPFWSLVQYTMFAVQARYEEGVADMDETIDRTAEIAHVSALLTHVEKLLAANSLD